MFRTVIILFCITLSLEWIAGIEMDGRGRRNKTELRTNKRIQEKRGFDNLHTNTNKLNRADDRRVAQPLSGFDIPLDAFSLHHPFLQSHVQEFEWSEWYFLFLTVFYKNSSELPSSTVDVSVLVPELTKALSAKLSVPPNTFSISKAEKYRSNSISANLSVTNHTIPELHHKLTNLHNSSPLFWLKGIRYKLVQVIHDKNQHLFLRNDGKSFSNKEVGLLIIISLGGIIIFLVMVMLALLNVKLFFLKDQENEMDSMLKEELEEMSGHDLDEGAIFTIEGKHEPLNCVEDPLLQDAQITTIEEERQQKFNTNMLKRLRYYKRFFF